MESNPMSGIKKKEKEVYINSNNDSNKNSNSNGNSNNINNNADNNSNKSNGKRVLYKRVLYKVAKIWERYRRYLIISVRSGYSEIIAGC